MNVIENIKKLFGSDNPVKKSARLYKKGLALAEKNHYREAVSLIEKAIALNKNSASFHNLLAISMANISREYIDKDETEITLWLNKAADAYWKAIIIDRRSNELDSHQLSNALDFVTSWDRAQMQRANSPSIDKRKEIYSKYKKGLSEAVSFDTFNNFLRKDTLNLVSGVADKKRENFKNILNEFNLSERQIKAIIQEGENENW